MIIPIREIQVSQRGLRHPECVIGILQALMRNELIEPVTLVPYPGRWVLHDGHHRLIALHLRERTHLSEGIDFKILPYDERFQKRTFGTVIDLIHRVTYATSQARKMPAAPSGSPSDHNPESPTCSNER